MQTEILDCGHPPSDHGPYDTGYGRAPNGKRYCYECCGERDRANMAKTGRATLYLSKDSDGHKITNWPGSINIKPWRVKTGRHNIAGIRFDCWFPFNGHVWHGVQYGNWTQILHCRQTKEKI